MCYFFTELGRCGSNCEDSEFGIDFNVACSNWSLSLRIFFSVKIFVLFLFGFVMGECSRVRLSNVLLLDIYLTRVPGCLFSKLNFQLVFIVFQLSKEILVSDLNSFLEVFCFCLLTCFEF